MKYLKLYIVLIIGFLVCSGSIQINAQPTATEAQTKEIQDVLDKMKDAKAKGAKDGDKEIRDLAKKAIELADKYYKVETPDNVEGGEAEYDPDVKGEGVTHQNGKKTKVKVGPKAFDTPGWLASTKIHEFFHSSQAKDGRWPPPPVVPENPDDIPGATMEDKIKYLEDLLKKLTKSTETNETEAYDKELENAKKTGLTTAQIEDLEKRRKEHYAALDAANQKKIDNAKANGETYKTAMAPSSTKSMFVITKTELFVAGTVLSEERTKVTIRNSQSVEGNVISVELNGKTTESTTDKQGHAILDISAIASGLVGTAIATIKVTDAKGREISTATTTIEQGQPMIFNRPEMSSLPNNLPSGEVVTIPGKNLGADANLVIGNQFQETLSASDYELTTFTDSKTGSQPAFVVTANGVSQSQMVNIYSLNFSLPKNSITPKEKVEAQVSYESIPVGTKLIFTNISPETINMTIPGGVNSGDKSIYTVTSTNGTLPVNITGRTKGSFKIGVDTDFKNATQIPR